MWCVRLRFSQIIFILTVSTILLSTLTQAHADLKVRGFADLIGSGSDTEYSISWLKNNGKNLNVESNSRLGLNLAAELSDRWSFAGQLVGRGASTFDGQPGYILAADWLFMTYRPLNELTFKVGRQIYPIFLFSESIDVGFNYLWTRLPTSLYGVAPVKALNGLSVAYRELWGDVQATAGAFGGAFKATVLAPGIGGTSIEDRDVWGGYLSLSSDNFKLQTSIKTSHPVGSFYIPIPGGTMLTVPFDLGNNWLYSFGGTVNFMNFTAIAEATRSLSTNKDQYNVTGAYGTLAYHFWDGLLTPHFTYGHMWSADTGSVFAHPVVQGHGASQTDLNQTILGLNLRVSNPLTLKLEYQRDDVSYVNTSLNLSVNTYTLSLDTVF